MQGNDQELLMDVTLLGIMKKNPDESVEDVILMLSETGMYTLKEAKAVLKALRKERFIVDGALSVKGMLRAKEAEANFKQ